MQKGFPNEDDAQRRFIHARYDFNGKDGSVKWLFSTRRKPQARNQISRRRKFYADLTQYILTLKDQQRSLILMGDMNIAPQDVDIGIGEKNAKRWLSQGTCSFLPRSANGIKRYLPVTYMTRIASYMLIAMNVLVGLITALKALMMSQNAACALRPYFDECRLSRQAMVQASAMSFAPWKNPVTMRRFGRIF